MRESENGGELKSRLGKLVLRSGRAQCICSAEHGPVGKPDELVSTSLRDDSPCVALMEKAVNAARYHLFHTSSSVYSRRAARRVCQ